MTITVFERTSSYCVQCVGTKRALDKAGIPYKAVAIEDQPAEWLQAHKDNGLMTAPIVEVSHADGTTEAWSGLRPDKISELEVA